jgi:hypothetical protein
MRYGCPIFPAHHLVVCGLQPLERMHGTRRALAIANASLSTYFDLKDGLAAALVFDHRDIAKLKTHCLVGTEAGIGGEQNIIVKLFRFPTKTGLLGIMRAFSRRLVKLLVLFRREPCSMRNLRPTRDTALTNPADDRSIRAAEPF